MRRRILWCTTGVMVSFAVLLGRLFVLCTGAHAAPGQPASRWQSGVQARADLEHLRFVRTDDARGRILYRNGEPWTGAWTDTEVGAAGGQRVRVGIHNEMRAAAKQRDPVVGQLGLPDVWPSAKVVPEQGRSGLEAAFDAELSGKRPGYVGTLADAKGRKYPQLYAIPPVSGADVRTTIDPAWQRAAEHALQAARAATGAVVVLDVPTGDVLAMASVNREDPWRNVAITAQTPGSVFKIVTLAAAMESYRYAPNAVFHCFGQVEHPGVQMKCWTVHGRETLLTAFAQSCDVAFAEVGMGTGRRAMERIAARLHVTDAPLQAVHGKPVLPGAEAGRVFARSGQDAGLLANTAIGQEDVRLSPLAAANLAATIARGGRCQQPRLVLDAERGGAVVREYRAARGNAAIARSTAAQIGAGMRAAVTLPTGTGHFLAGSAMQPAVKTGTAEVGRGLVNAWVVGYAPAAHPRIAFCVFDGAVPSAVGHRAAREMVQALAQSYTQFFPSTDIG
ncbi:hypothetical protein JI721_13665 [Alicyclobacillus cycloheptanicus]|uniref:Cell division protein FtsI/penicillin-binding protein 2 n=1 Tax=Alicyclobacillus cycloheptanicus TaxID=1457 RepID=A0ABT9XJM2_9BACL|nr:penicillin-binding transpeptidase domain-containing protein [Alicyclobacillus cycloheptanicus]MDQ0190509.1 cell division protein FtsI/penicillin-binding protein 2 [Alicyclobacillus cycloheptanicus]WDM00729.1 hypothetical protein JI721_13665 [Alicyclobacillus cycloheptanicus]